MNSLHDFGALGPIDSQAHGSRACYQAGCRCLPCRSANAGYAALRARTADAGLILATEARAYLLTLQSKGLGSRRAAELSGLSRTTIQAIRAGERTRILTTHHYAILAIDAYPAMGQRMTSKRAKHLLKSLGAEGFTLQILASKLGLRVRDLALHPMITVKRSLQVQALWRKLTADEAQP